MKSKLLSATLLLAISLAGCTTFPASSPEDTLAVFSLSNDIMEGKSVFGYYYLVIKDIGTDEEVRKLRLPASREYVTLQNLDRGRYYVASYYFQSEHGQPGSRKTYNKDFCPFTLSPGTLTVAPKAFGTKLAKKEGGDIYMQFQAPGNSDFEKTLARLEEDYPEELSTWKIQPPQ